MNLGDLHAICRLQLRDEDKAFVPDADLTKWINVAQRDLADRLKLLDEAVTGGTTVDSKITPPSDFIAPQYLEVGNEPVEFVDDEVFKRTQDGDLGYNYTVARIFESTIEIAPNIKDGTSYSLEYTKGPVDLSLTTDIPAIPAELHPRLAWFATAMALIKEREEALADRFMQMYTAHLPAAGLGQARVRPGPLRLRVEPTAWDRTGTHTGAGKYET